MAEPPNTSLESTPEEHETSTFAPAAAEETVTDTAEESAAGAKGKGKLKAPIPSEVATGVSSRSGVSAGTPGTRGTSVGTTPISTEAGIDGTVNPADFEGNVMTDNVIPSADTLRRIEGYPLLDREGQTHTFKSLYSGPHCARRVLVIFVRHFFCGNCQGYLKSLSESITPEGLLQLPISTSIAVVGCGTPELIDLYTNTTGCRFPIFTDPTRRLYTDLGMVRTLRLGSRPAYQRRSLVWSTLASVFQGLGQMPKGLAMKSGDSKQIGGEFLFEPLNLLPPIAAPVPDGSNKPKAPAVGGDGHGDDDTGEGSGSGIVELKRVTWCHRMRNTRDHAEIPELMEVLGLEGNGRRPASTNGKI